tara:strand:+ start:261 stop:479 length:219 start_codon:yes stop_codon:yes gene_type:complete
MYTVHDTGQGMLKIVDASRGIQAGVISPRGKVITPPVVNGNQVSFVVQHPDGTKMGTTHKLPTGQLINQFRV